MKASEVPVPQPRLTVIHLARKPLSGTVAATVLKYGTGALNIGASRIGTADEMSFSRAAPYTSVEGDQGRTWNPTSTPGMEREQHVGGRWPANVILQHRLGCSRTGTTTVPGNRTDTRPEGDGGREDRTQWMFRPTEATRRGYSDEDGLETIDLWECAEGCPVVDLDAQGGHSITGVRSSRSQDREVPGTAWYVGNHKSQEYPNDEGGASRFFKQVQDK